MPPAERGPRRPARWRVPAGAAWLFLLGACAGPEPPADYGSPGALARRLPASVAGFERREELPQAAAAEARTVSYATRGRLAAGALVDLALPAGGGAAAQDGPEAPAAQAALAAMIEEATGAAAAPRRVQVTGRLVLPADGPTPAALSCAETAGRYGRERVQGLLCAGVLHGVLVRLRVTMPQASPPPADARAFATGIVAGLRTTGP